MVVEQVHVEPEDAPLVVEADVDRLDLAALMVRADEVLAAVLGELDVVAEQACGPRDEELLGPRVHDLDAEPTTDVRGDALHLGERQLEEGCDDRAHARRGLRRGVHAHPLVVRIPARVHAARLERGRGRTVDVEPERQPVGCGVDAARRITDRLRQRRGDVVRDVVVHRMRRGLRDLVPDDRRQHLVLDVDASGRILGDVAVAGDDHRDRLADMVDLAVREDVLRARRREGRVRDEDRQALLQARWEVLVGVDGDEAVDLQRRADVDVEDARVRVGAADDRDLVGVLSEVVEVATLPAQQPRVLAAHDRSTEEPRRHDRPPSSGPPTTWRARGSTSVPRNSSAACSTAARIPA